MNLLKINNSEIFYTSDWDIGNLREYYYFILTELKNFLTLKGKECKINFGNKNFSSDINIDFQYEHTIIFNGHNYTCRIENYDYLKKLDYVLEYSNPNIVHSKKFNIDKLYTDKLIYFPPFIYDLSNDGKRIKDIITIHNSSPRRHIIHSKIDMDYFHIVAGNNVFDKESIKKVLDEYKILVNIHQTDTHHTLEELRVLPSLMTGILVISEDVPYKEEIPYSKHIIWSEYENLPNKIKDVLSNYEGYRKKYLIDLDETILNMKKNLKKNINKMINKK